MKTSEKILNIAKFNYGENEIHIRFESPFEARRAEELYRMVEDDYYPAKTPGEAFRDAKLANALQNAGVISYEQYLKIYNF